MAQENLVTISCAGFNEHRSLFLRKNTYRGFNEFRRKVCSLYISEEESLLDKVGIVYQQPDKSIFRIVDDETWKAAEYLIDKGLLSEVIIVDLMRKAGDTETVQSVGRGGKIRSVSRELLEPYRRQQLEWEDAVRAHGQDRGWEVLNDTEKQHYRTLLRRVEAVTGSMDYVVNPYIMVCPVCSKQLAAKRICDQTGAVVYGPKSANGHLARVHLKDEGDDKVLAEELMARMARVVAGAEVPPMRSRMQPPPKRFTPFLDHAIAMSE